MTLNNPNMNALACVSHADLFQLRVFCSLANNNQYDLEEVDAYGNTALLKACYLGKLEAVQTLLRYRANIRAINYFGQNALTLATYAGHESIVGELLKHRSYDDFNLSSIVPALCVATLRQNKRMMQLLKKLAVNNDDIQTSHGLSPEDIQDMLDRGKPSKEFKAMKF